MGQFAVVVPSLDLVVVTLYGAQPASFDSPPDIAQYKGREYMPLHSDRLLTLGLCDGGFNGWGCWNFTALQARRSAGSITPGMPSCDCSKANDDENDLLAGVMQ